MPRRLAVLLALWLALAAAAAQPQVDTSRQQDLERQISEYERLLESRQQELGAIESALGDTRSTLEQRLAERDRISRELAELRAQRERLQAEIRELEAQLSETEARIEAILADLESLHARIQGLLVNLHRQRSGRFAGVLSQAESFHELSVKNHYLSLLSRQDVDLVAELDAARAELLAAQNTLSQQLAARAAAEEELRGTQARLEGAEQELAGVIAELEATRAGQLAQRESLLEAQQQLERTLGDLDQQLAAEVRRLQEERERLRREAAQAGLEALRRRELEEQAAAVGRRIENLTGPITASTSGYVYPVAGHTVVSRYGEENNSFMALRASAANAAVVAVQEGIVRVVSAVSANDGYLVAVAHSERLTTVYTNLRPPLVSVGDRVEKGQVIGYLGGGTLVPADVLRLWVQVSESGRSAFVDPGPALGF